MLKCNSLLATEVLWNGVNMILSLQNTAHTSQNKRQDTDVDSGNIWWGMSFGSHQDNNIIWQNKFAANLWIMTQNEEIYIHID